MVRLKQTRIYTCKKCKSTLSRRENFMMYLVPFVKMLSNDKVGFPSFKVNLQLSALKGPCIFYEQFVCLLHNGAKWHSYHNSAET